MPSNRSRFPVSSLALCALLVSAGLAVASAQVAVAPGVHIPQRAPSGPQARYLDELRTEIDVVAGGSSDEYRYAFRVNGFVYGYGMTTDDAVRVEWRSGNRVVTQARCRIRGESSPTTIAETSGFNVAVFNCESPKEITDAGDYVVQITYLDDATDRQIAFRPMNVRVGRAFSWGGGQNYRVIPFVVAADRLASSALWIRAQPFGGARVMFVFWGNPKRGLDQPSSSDLNFRCDRNGERIGENLQAAGQMLHPRSGLTAEHRIQNGVQEEYGYRRFELLTNLSYRGHGVSSQSPYDLARNPGDYRCELRFQGEPVREFRFTVQPNGDISPHPEQVGPNAPALAPGMTLVDTRFPNPTLWEHGISVDAMRAGSFLGRPWSNRAAVAPMLDALPRTNVGALEPEAPRGATLLGPGAGSASSSSAASRPGRRR